MACDSPYSGGRPGERVDPTDPVQGGLKLSIERMAKLTNTNDCIASDELVVLVFGGRLLGAVGYLSVASPGALSMCPRVAHQFVLKL